MSRSTLGNKLRAALGRVRLAGAGRADILLVVTAAAQNNKIAEIVAGGVERLAKEIRSGTLGFTKKELEMPLAISADAVIRYISRLHNVTESRLKSPQRAREVAWPRQEAAFLMREICNLSLPQIGRALGDRDHTTIAYGCRQIESRMQKDPILEARITAAIVHFDGVSD